ncbi:MAG: VacJ family lipoprotein [Proteobacteria bacterium]|nr:VacJ family lipoprotein [Pseudomonadota bacterium]MBU1388512.1 VacJ family lipoprotein [Pseudomonadota bacterium]MBU1544809.1 VacJ family lipoprotein [Pseudomonadota bacterium]MBU2429871.1 VacJ family lipoprotein [Pseudomonadota bacterium]MBU2481062.1 VacJ family lipoprotein [Pseudomonadota bacterium]
MEYPEVLMAANIQTQPKNMMVAENTEDPDAEEDEDFVDDFSDSDTPLEVDQIADPLYYFNYAMYSINDFLYFAALKPIATGYKYITPDFLRKGVYNFFHNLLFPVRFVNNILQGEISDAGSEVGIFAVNTTFGVLGLIQVAQNHFDMKTTDEDLGQTLGSYTIGNGFYLVLPILGPSSLRDALGLVGDSFLTPLNYVEPWELSLGLKVYDSINDTTFRLGDYEALKAAAIDPYVALRDGYVQYRKQKIKE